MQLTFRANSTQRWGSLWGDEKRQSIANDDLDSKSERTEKDGKKWRSQKKK